MEKRGKETETGGVSFQLLKRKHAFDMSLLNESQVKIVNKQTTTTTEPRYTNYKIQITKTLKK